MPCTSYPEIKQYSDQLQEKELKTLQSKCSKYKAHYLPITKWMHQHKIMVAPVQKSAMEIPESCTNPSIWCRQIQISTRHVAATWPGIILCMCSANERWRYSVTPSLIGWAHTQNHPCMAPGHMPWLFDQESLLVKARLRARSYPIRHSCFVQALLPGRLSLQSPPSFRLHLDFDEICGAGDKLRQATCSHPSNHGLPEKKKQWVRLHSCYRR